MSTQLRVSDALANAYGLAFSRAPDLHEKWIRVSFRIGSILPDSLLGDAVQRAGDLDVLVRALEDEFQPSAAQTPIALYPINLHRLISEQWVSSVYEILRLLRRPGLKSADPALDALFGDVELIRVPLNKHELAKDNKLKKAELSPVMSRWPATGSEGDLYIYDHKDPKRAHIMPSGISGRGSRMWQVLDVIGQRTYWVERRDLSDRFLSLWPL